MSLLILQFDQVVVQLAPAAAHYISEQLQWLQWFDYPPACLDIDRCHFLFAFFFVARFDLPHQLKFVDVDGCRRELASF